VESVQLSGASTSFKAASQAPKTAQ